MTEDFNPFSLTGKKIIVTGASSGIGRQCAIDCSRMGASVALLGRNEERLKETISNLNGEDHKYFSIDVNKISNDFVDNLVSIVGPFDGMVYSAGVEQTLSVKYTSKEVYSRLMDTNAFSAFEFIRQLSRKKNLNDSASIVLISSISSLIARGGLVAYAASKGALNSAARVFALELSKRKIRVNCIQPGTILTPMMEDYLSNIDEKDVEKRKSGFLLGLGQTSDISMGAVYLLSDASKWVTGQNLIIDGGYTCK